MGSTHILSLFFFFFVVVVVLSAVPSSIAARSPRTSPLCLQKDMRFPALCQSVVDAHLPDSPNALLRAAISDAVALAGSAEAKAEGLGNDGCSSAFDDAGDYFQKALGYLDAGARLDLLTELSATMGALQPCSDEFDVDARESPVGAAYTRLFRLAVVSLTLAADNLK